MHLYPDFRKSIDGLAELAELDIKVAVFNPLLFVFLNKPRNRVKVLYWERKDLHLWLKRLVSERFKISPDHADEAMVLSVQELNCKRSMNPTYSKIGGALSKAMRASSSKAARPQSLLPSRLVAGAQVRGAATHRALGRWL